MTHLHVPDGVLPAWLWLAGWLLAAGALWLAERRVGAHERTRRVPLLGVVSALVLVSMSLEIVPIAYHVNLTVVAGVLLGPWLGLVAGFVVSVLLALLGHGGVTVIGLNAILLGAEIVLGWALFRGLLRMVGRARVPLAAGTATVLTLALTTGLLVGIVALAGTTWSSQPTGMLDPTTLSFRTETDVHADEPHGDEHADEAEDAHEHGPPLSVGRFATVVFVLGPVGWMLEALLTAAILGYVATIRADLVFPGAPPARRLPGDEQGLR